MGFKEIAALVVAALLSAALILLLRPLLVRHALAHPNARSLHAVPTPQGGGAAVVLAALATLALVGGFAAESRTALTGLLPLAGGVVLLAVVGAVDDIRAVAAFPRLVLQALAVAAVVATLPADQRVLPAVPLALERAAEFLAGLWFVNLVNFMDGLDWMTVAETVPVTAAVSAFALAGTAPSEAGLVALALCGAMLGFAPFNRPVARLFLGDVGSLPVGLILFWLLLTLAGRGHLAAALLLPLYYVADATITLARRLARGERITQAHRSHFYQLAVARGLAVMAVVRAVFAVNLVLAALAAATVAAASVAVDLAALAVGIVVVAVLLVALSRGKR
jgi:UDP-N-acetylmuramyl pentapeptide phosphotransferase/UDP-N-acetylglucosamine-1-phosphate transferase